MPIPSLLNPTVLNGVIEELEYPDSFLGLGLTGDREQNPWPVAQWDVIASNRDVAEPTVPNTEAKIAPPLKHGQRDATMMYIRQKKIMKQTTIEWMRTPGEIALKNAERAIMREVTDLDEMVDRQLEVRFWDMLNGMMSLDYKDVKADVDYAVKSTHRPTVATGWGMKAADIITDVRAWKRLIENDGGGARANRLFGNGVTFDQVLQNTAIIGLMSDRMKDQYLSTGGTVSGLLGMEWQEYNSVYTEKGATNKYIPDNVVIMVADANRPYYVMEGPSADWDAPRGHIGKFSKSWIKADPSNYQFMIEWHVLPILERPDNIVYANVA